MSLELIIRTLDRAGVKYALIGAVALAARGASRSTLDLDLLTANRIVLTDSFWAEARAGGVAIEVRKGDWEDPLAGVVRVAMDEPIDIVVAKYRWQADVVDRAEEVSIRGLTLPIPSKSDLILLKLFAGGYRDMDDARRLLEVGPREPLIAEVSALLAELPEEMRARWERLLAETV